MCKLSFFIYYRFLEICIDIIVDFHIKKNKFPSFYGKYLKPIVVTKKGICEMVRALLQETGMREQGYREEYKLGSTL